MVVASNFSLYIVFIFLKSQVFPVYALTDVTWPFFSGSEVEGLGNLGSPAGPFQPHTGSISAACSVVPLYYLSNRQSCLLLERLKGPSESVMAVPLYKHLLSCPVVLWMQTEVEPMPVLRNLFLGIASLSFSRQHCAWTACASQPVNLLSC